MLHHVVVVALLIFTVMNLFILSLEIGHGFDPDGNYWYWNVEKEIQDYGMQCTGRWQFIIP
jgi:hypothetical protein